MADLFGPFDPLYDASGNPIPGTGIWAQAEWYRHAPSWAPSGVIDTPAATVAAGGFGFSSSGLTVSIGLGRGWVRGGGYERTDTAWTNAVTANATGNPRRDRIVLRRDLAAKTVGLARKEGTPAVTPAAPSLTQVETGIWEEPLFSFLVPASSGTTISGVIDERVWVDPGGNGRTRPRSLLIERASSTATDAYSAARTNLLGDTWVAAPAGDYLVHATLAVQTAANTGGEVFIVANGTTITKAGTRADVPAGVVGVLSYTRPYRHSGGDLAVALDHHPNGSVTVNNATTQMVVAYLGVRG